MSATPASFTPYLTSSDDQIDQIVQCGSSMYAVGKFAQITQSNGTVFERNNAFAFNATTGAVASWNPNVNGEVSAIALDPGCDTAYLGGAFSKAGAQTVSHLAEVSTPGGIVSATFHPKPDGEVYTLALNGSQLLVGGAFKNIAGTARPALASVSPTTGAITSYANLAISGNVPEGTTRTFVFKLRMNPAGTQVLVLGNFKTVAGQLRLEGFVADLGQSSASLDGWYTPGLAKPCAKIEAYFARAGTWSPDGSRIYLATSGVHGMSPLCDSVIAFSSSSSGNQNPIWINKTGCDSLYAVAADATAVYMGGHERWANNPDGCNNAGNGSVDRPGVGALAASTGAAVAWDPTRDRGHGADDALRTSAGLWVASDDYLGSTHCGAAYHPGICFFPNG